MTPSADLDEWAAAAAAGDAAALDRLLRALADDVYHLCFRMLGHRSDAEDATQEILLKVVTRLATFRGEASLRTWVWKVATNHVLSWRRGVREVAASFEALEQMLEQGVAAHLPPPADLDAAVLEEEIKLGCTQTMLLSLDRPHRLAFILGAVLNVPGPEAADALGISPATFRKRLSRARLRLRSFMDRNCGLVEPSTACRCSLQVGPATATGVVHPGNLQFVDHPRRIEEPRLWQQHRAIEEAEAEVELLRSHPAYGAAPQLIERLRQLIAATPR